MPQLFTKDIALVQQFFESMCKVCLLIISCSHCLVIASLLFNSNLRSQWKQEEADVRLAIQEALSMMVGAYVNLQGALLNLMEALVAAYIAKVSFLFKLLMCFNVFL